jgi:DNA-nicking Smr family endonuclease
MDEQSRTLWEKVCATVNRLGGPRSPRTRIDPVLPGPTVLDLHGFTVDEAYREVRDFLDGKTRMVTVITGRSGVIRREFPHWLAQFSNVSSYEETNDGGAFKVKLKKLI